MKIIIDTNIIFSALLNTKSTIGDGDKPLYNGLKLKKYKRVFNTMELLALRNPDN